MDAIGPELLALAFVLAGMFVFAKPHEIQRLGTRQTERFKNVPLLSMNYQWVRNSSYVFVTRLIGGISVAVGIVILWLRLAYPQ